MSDHSHASHDSHGPVTRSGETADETLEHAAHAHEGDHGHGGIGKYLLVFAALCGLTTMSFLTYSSFWPWRDEPQVGWAFMMAVSCTKAMLVVLFFMHVWWEANWKYVLTIPAAMMAVFMVIMLVPDIGMRNRMVAQERAIHMARPSDLLLLEQASGDAEHAAPAAH
ncbi:MAG: cytochrome C oxidase subunit IV family protein [Planctomycetota bacterium]